MTRMRQGTTFLYDSFTLLDHPPLSGYFEADRRVRHAQLVR